MIIYIFLFFIALSGFLFNTNKNKQNKLTYLFVAFGSLLFVSAFRASTVGTDLDELYAHYYPHFSNVPWNKIQSVTMSEHWEWGFCAFCKVLCMFSKEEQFFIAVSSVICIIPYAIFIYRNSRDVVFSTFFYVAFHVYMISLNIVRQSLAVGIVLLGYEFLKKKQYLKYTVMVLIASLFHTSAIITIILILFDKISYKKGYLALALIGMLVFPFTYSLIFQWILGLGGIQNQYAFYEIGQGHFQGFVTYHTLGMFAISLFAFFVMYVQSSRINIQKGMINISRYSMGWSYSLLTYAALITTFLRFSAFFANVTSRMSYYFIPFIMIAYPYAMSKFTINKRKYLKSMMILALTLFYFIILPRAKENWGTIPFEWCDIL